MVAAEIGEQCLQAVTGRYRHKAKFLFRLRTFEHRLLLRFVDPILNPARVFMLDPHVLYLDRLELTVFYALAERFAGIVGMHVHLMISSSSTTTTQSPMDSK